MHPQHLLLTVLTALAAKQSNKSTSTIHQNQINCIVSSAVTVSVKINLPNGIGMVNPGNRISLIHPAVLICESYQRNPMFAKSLGKIEISAGDSLSWKVNLPTVFRLNIDLHVDLYGG
jgi:hypothetical protein